MEYGLSLTLLLACGHLSPHGAALSRLNRRRCALICQGGLVSMGGLPFKKAGERGRVGGEEGRETAIRI